MFGFFKRIAGANQGSADDSEDSYELPQVHLVDRKDPNDFIRLNFPVLGQKSTFINEAHKNRKIEKKQIDISIYFEEKDKYLVSENDAASVISKEFLQLPNNDPNFQYINTRVEALAKYDQTLNYLVKESALKDYDQFREGLNNLELLKSKAGKCIEDLKLSRGSLTDVKSNIAGYSLKIARLLRQRAINKKAAIFLKKFREHFKGISQAVQVIEKGDSTKAYEIVPIIKRAKLELEKNSTISMKLECLQNCEKYLDGKFDDLQKNVYKDLENIFIDWDENKFQSCLNCWFMLQQHYPSEYTLLEKIPGVIKRSIKMARNKVIEAYISQKPDPSTTNGALKVTECIKKIPKDSFLNFLNRMFHQMSMFMYNTHLCCRYLEEHQKDQLTLTISDSSTYDLSGFYSSLKISLLTTRKELWQAMQKKVVKILNKAHMNDIGYYDLISLLQSCKIFMEIGEDFSYTPSKIFREDIQCILKNNYTHFHNYSLQNLKAMLSVEEWKKLPLPQNYRHQGLIELLKRPPNVYQQFSSLFKNEEASEKAGMIGMKNGHKATNTLSTFVGGNPFQIHEKLLYKKSKSCFVSSRKGPLMSSIEDLKAEEASSTTDSLEEPNDGDDICKEIVEEDLEVAVSSTGNFIVKNFEKYILFMDLMRFHALEVFKGLLTTFEFFCEIYALMKEFIPVHIRKALFTDLETEINNFEKLKDEEVRITTLENLHDLFLFQKSYKNVRKQMLKILDYFDNSNFKISDDQLRDSSSKEFYGLNERTLAIESVLFVYDHLRYIQNRASKMVLNVDEANILQEYYQTYEKVIPELRSFTYACLMPNLLQNENVFQPIQLMKWELQEFYSTPSPYTYKILQFVNEFYKQVESYGTKGLPKKVQKDLKKDIINFMFRKLIDNFSKVKKVNTNGRNMMLADFNYISNELSSMMDPRSKEKKDLCESYIKAWYMSADELTNFIIENKELYGLRELETLISTSNSTKNFTKIQKRELYSRIETEFLQIIKTKLYI